MSSTSNAVLTADRIWLDGAVIPWSQGQVPIMTHALHYGLGVFEGIRAYRTHDGRLAVFRLREHMRRFADSAHIIQLKMPYSEEQIGAGLPGGAPLAAGALRQRRLPPADRLHGRRGDGPGRGQPHPGGGHRLGLGRLPGREGAPDGIRAKVSSFTRMHVNVNMVRGKITGQYVNSILAKREAVLGGYDEAILLDIAGFVAEASGENIFIANKKDIVRTPPLSSPILAGITRRTVLRLLRDMGHPVEEVTFTRDALYISNEVFFTGTAAEITPVREVDDRQIGTGQARPGGEEDPGAVLPGGPGARAPLRRVAHLRVSAAVPTSVPLVFRAERTRPLRSAGPPITVRALSAAPDLL